MASVLEVEQAVNGGKSIVKFKGHISEESDYSSVKFDGVQALLFDVDGITLINSIGIQKWIKFMASIPSTIQLAIARCPLRIINQINLFPDFFAKKPVAYLSFYVPYFCEKCDDSRSLLIEAQTIKPQAPAAPPMKCPTCSSAMNFDGIENKFFAFMKSA